MSKLQLTPDGRPPEIPEWVPLTSAELTLDFLVREWSRIAFDNDQPTPIRMKALESISKHAGLFIERVEIKNVDTLRAGALGAMFDSMTLEEKREWMKQQALESPTEIAVNNLTPYAEPVNALAPTTQQLAAAQDTPSTPTASLTSPEPLPTKKKRESKREAFVNSLPEFLKR